eukprot:3384733-Pyramimonas_sp.AAC.1
MASSLISSSSAVLPSNNNYHPHGHDASSAMLCQECHSLVRFICRAQYSAAVRCYSLLLEMNLSSDDFRAYTIGSRSRSSAACGKAASAADDDGERLSFPETSPPNDEGGTDATSPRSPSEQGNIDDQNYDFFSDNINEAELPPTPPPRQQTMRLHNNPFTTTAYPCSHQEGR